MGLFRQLFIISMLLLSSKIVIANAVLPKPQLLSDLRTWQIELASEIDDEELFMDFTYELQLHINSRYDGSENSLLRILDLIKDLNSGQKPEANAKIHRLIILLSENIREVRERQEPLWTFIKSYISISGVLNPQNIEEFEISREYSNSKVSRSAHFNEEISP